MRALRHITLILLLGITSCRELHPALLDDSLLASVDSRRLMLSELAPIIPNGYKGEDSVAFAELYVEKWILRQIKLLEAEIVFKNVESDIDAMVQAYREQLLIQRLEERYVNMAADTIFTDERISQYYQQHSSSLRLKVDIVKGEVVRMPLGFDQSSKLKALMSSSLQAKHDDVVSICEKNDLSYTDFSQSWVEGTQILDKLPMARDQKPDKIFSQRGVGVLRDANYEYLYQIFDLKRSGDIAPLEWVKPTITTILFAERQQRLVRAGEEEVYRRAAAERSISRIE